MKQIDTLIQKIDFIIIITIVMLFTACSEAENFYEKLDATPEVLTNYGLVYEIGDTMTLIGRLNPDKNLIITVGNANANYIAKINPGYHPMPGYSSAPDEIKFAITETMGTGQQPITISSNGNTISIPAIEIIGNKGVVNDTLVMREHAVLNSDDILLYCRNGKGDIYVYRAGDNKIEHIKKDGSTITSLTLSEVSDEYGTFTVKTFYSGGADNKGEGGSVENIYFSVLTTDNSAENASNDIYRLCKYNIINNRLTTLNRTLSPNRRTRDKVLSTVLPFEGNIKDVKILTIRNIYPDNRGNVYIQLGGYAIAMLTASGDFKYIFHASSGTNDYPVIWDPVKQSVLMSYEFFPMLPGVVNVNPGPILADDGQMYQINIAGKGNSRENAVSTINMYSLSSRSLIYRYAKRNSRIIIDNKYPAGPFKIITGVFYNDYETIDLAGFMPMPESRLLVLGYEKTYNMMDFNREYADRYANIKMAESSFSVTTSDIGLNYDEEKMIYTTSNDKTKILKSTLRK